jgi:Thioredoxin-like
LKVTPVLVNWKKDADAALAEAKSSGKPVLVDFSAAPG